MLVFVDDSGDTGLKMGQGSSGFFTVALVVFEENDEAQAADARISLLRREMGKPDDFEFHFKENSDGVRRAFLEAAIRYNFFYFGFVVNKSRLYAGSLPTTEAFYAYICGLIFESAKPYLDNAAVKIDASGGRKFQRWLASYLKTKINTPGRPRGASAASRLTIRGGATCFSLRTWSAGRSPAPIARTRRILTCSAK